MKIELSQIVASTEPLSKLMTQPMPSATAFRCSKILKLVQVELESYEEARKNLIKQYGKDDEIKPDSKNWKEFLKGMDELLKSKVSFNTEKIKEENLSKVEISPADVMALSWLIKE